MSFHLFLSDLAAQTPVVLETELPGPPGRTLLAWRHLLVVARPAPEHCALDLLAPRIEAHGGPAGGARIGLPTIPFCAALPWPRWRDAAPQAPDLPERLRRAFEAACGAPAQERLRLAGLLAFAHNAAAGLPPDRPVALDGPGASGDAPRQLIRIVRNLRTATRRALFQDGLLTLAPPAEIVPVPWDGSAHRRLHDAQALARLLRGERLPPLPGA